MKNILMIFKRDLKSIIKSPAAIIIIIGICFIPSLYAWINIQACWDVYNNTSTFPVAIVNNDKGATLDGKSINIGDEVVGELKNNHQIGWNFVNTKAGSMGVVDGTYYAMIEIPENFSEDLGSILSNNPKKPEINYIVNTKINPVAGKISEEAKVNIVDQITSNFVQAVNKEAFSFLNGVGGDVEKNKSEIIQLKDSIINLNKNMNLVTGLLQNVSSGSTNLSTCLTELQNTLPQIISGIDGAQGNLENNKNLISNTENSLNNSLNNLRFNLTEAQAGINKVNNLVSSLKNTADNINSTEISRVVNSSCSEIDLIINSVNNNINFLNEISKIKDSREVHRIIEKLKTIQSNLNTEKSDLINLQNRINSGEKLSDEIINSVSSRILNMSSEIKNIVDSYESKALPELKSVSSNLINATQDATSILETSKGLASQVGNLLKSATDGCNLAASTSSELNEQISTFKDTVSSLSDKLQKLNNDELTQVVNILQSKPEIMANFIANPFNLKEENIYVIPNYGSGMAPIYTVLAMWVGALLLTALFKTEPPDFPGSENITVIQKYFGKMLFFILLALIQGFIVAMGDKFILGVYTVNTPLLIIFSLISSVTFTIILYTLVSIFGNVGKALGIVLMVLQIAGSGGTYPIQVDPLIFRKLQPFFPFTYSLGGLREAIAGPLFSSVAIDFMALILISLLFILIGVLLKKPLYNRVRNFEEKFQESGVAE